MKFTEEQDATILHLRAEGMSWYGIAVRMPKDIGKIAVQRRWEEIMSEKKGGKRIGKMKFDDEKGAL